MDQAAKGTQADELKRLHRGMVTLQECKTKGDIYQKTLRVLEQILEFDFCALQLHKENTLVAKRKESDHKAGDPVPYRIGEELSTITLKRGEVIRDDDQANYAPLRPEPERFPSFISVPVETLGTLQVFSTREGVFTDRDEELLRILATHLRERLGRAELEGDLREKAFRDQLTGLYNRYYLHKTLATEADRARRYGHTLSLLMVDINGFKEVNDYYSHAKGDEVLRDIGKVLAGNVREVDTVFRYGGDEFLILLPETGEGSRVVAKRLKEEVGAWSEESEGLEFPLSIATGISNFAPDEEIAIAEKISKADHRMYQDKKDRAG